MGHDSAQDDTGFLKKAHDVEAARIKSIIHPTLADHVRREALKAADEIKRAG